MPNPKTKTQKTLRADTPLMFVQYKCIFQQTVKVKHKKEIREMKEHYPYLSNVNVHISAGNRQWRNETWCDKKKLLGQNAWSIKNMCHIILNCISEWKMLVKQS